MQYHKMRKWKKNNFLTCFVLVHLQNHSQCQQSG
jgi:hypothetical protein